MADMGSAEAGYMGGKRARAQACLRESAEPNGAELQNFETRGSWTPQRRATDSSSERESEPWQLGHHLSFFATTC